MNYTATEPDGWRRRDGTEFSAKVETLRRGIEALEVSRAELEARYAELNATKPLRVASIFALTHLLLLQRARMDITEPRIGLSKMTA